MKMRDSNPRAGFALLLTLLTSQTFGQEGMLPPLRPDHEREESPPVIPQIDGNLVKPKDAGAESALGQSGPVYPGPGVSMQATGDFRDPPRKLQPNNDAAQPIPAFSETPPTGAQPAAFQEYIQPFVQQSVPVVRDSALAEHLIDELKVSARPLIARYQAVSLYDLLTNSDANQRKPMVHQYWKTWQACAEYLFAIDELQWMEQLGQPRDEQDRLVLEAARSMIADAMAEKELMMMRQQQELGRFWRGDRSGAPLWPSDNPMAGDYETRFDLYGSQGQPSETLQGIDSVLPAQQDLIVSRAGTVQRCRNAILHTSREFAQSGGTCATLLQGLYLSRETHAAFLRSVAEYNRNIAEYALTVKPRQTRASEVVAMLIPVESATPEMKPGDSGLRQASLPNNGAYPSTAMNPFNSAASAGTNMPSSSGALFPQPRQQPAYGNDYGASPPRSAAAASPPALRIGDANDGGRSSGFQGAPPTAPFQFDNGSAFRR